MHAGPRVPYVLVGAHNTKQIGYLFPVCETRYVLSVKLSNIHVMRPKAQRLFEVMQ